MHPYTLAKALGLAAGREDLIVAQGLAAALADALGGKDLDDVGAIGDSLADVLPDLRYRHALLADRRHRRQQPGSGYLPPGNRIAQRQVARGADALHGGESRHQHHVRILDAIDRLLDRRLAWRHRAAGAAEVCTDMDVRIDQAGKQRELRQVVARARTTALDPCDASALDADDDIALDAAAPIDERSSPDARLLRSCNRRRADQDGGKEGSDFRFDAHAFPPVFFVRD